MKSGHSRSQRFPGASSSLPKDGMRAGGGGTTPSGRRRRWFQLLALVLPLVVLGLLECGLRLAGYGFETSFFLQTRDAQQALLVENPKFGWRFFPPAIARTPQPLSLAAIKPADTIRIFVLGESAAMGDPEPAYGFPRQLERMLAARDPRHKFEVVNTAMTAINSHVIREIARDCMPRQGDFWVIYAGNNEVVGPFGAGTIFGRQASGVTFIRTGLLVKSTRLGQWLSAVPGHAADPLAWQGMEMFLPYQIGRNAPGLQIVHENFARNLADIVEMGRRAGATVLLATMPVNLKDSPPFASQHRPGLSAAQLEQWDGHYARGRQAQEANRFAEALEDYAEASQIDGEFAELAFRRAMCESALGSTNAAFDYLLARDLDTLRFRADSTINQIIRKVAVTENINLIDAEQECARHSPDGITGESLFYDHVHLNFTGNYLLAALFAGEVEKKLAGVSSASGASLLAEAEVARRLALTDFDRRRIGEEMRLRLRQPPFASQLNASVRDEKWRGILESLPASPARSCEDYQAALELAPGDWVLHANFARLLEAADEARAAAQQWQAVTNLLPREPDAWFHLGNLAYRAGKLAAAQYFFQESLKRNPNLLEALNGLGLVLVAQDQVEAALRQYKMALRLAPAYSAARVNLAVALANRGDVPAALAEYQKTLQLDTNNVAARINLAKLLAGQGKPDQAMALYEQALALDPDQPVANFDLANALLAQGRHAEALPYLQAAVRAQPDFVDARYNLALELARAGNLADALPHFAEVVRLQPDFVNARFNYGIALAKQHRFTEAASQFQETLKRQPDHAAAKSALERIRQMANSHGETQEPHEIEEK